MHRHLAAEGLARMGVCKRSTEDQERTRHQVYSQSRLCRQTAVRALMALAAMLEPGTAPRRLSRYLPVDRGPVIITEADDGNIAALGVTTVFGSNPPAHLGPRRPKAAQMDLAINLLVQRTRDWALAKEMRREFAREFLEDAVPGMMLNEDAITAWLNRHQASRARETVALGV